MTLAVANGTFAVVSDEIDWLIHRLKRKWRRTKFGEIRTAARLHASGHSLTGVSQDLTYTGRLTLAEAQFRETNTLFRDCFEITWTSSGRLYPIPAHQIRLLIRDRKAKHQHP